MTGNAWIVIAVAVATYITRISGFAIARRPIPPAVDRFLNFVPVAAFAALIATGVTPESPDLGPRVVAVLLAGVAVLRWKTLWAGLAAGMAAFWIATLLFTGGPG